MDKKEVKRILYIVTGCLILSISINVFLKPNGFVLGGVTGLGIIFDKLSKDFFGVGFPVSISNILINLPLFLLGFKAFGHKFLGSTIFATLLLSFGLVITDFLPEFKDDIFLAAIFGAVLDGIGLGLVIKARCSTGGTDLLAIILNKRFKSIPISKILLCIDSVIIIFGVFVFGLRPTLYAMISAFIISKVIGAVIDGFDFAKAVIIISEKPDEIGSSILNMLDRGATALHGHGMYTQNRKDIIFCVVQQKQIPDLKAKIYEIDERAFVVIANVSEVIGYGFKKVND